MLALFLALAALSQQGKAPLESGLVRSVELEALPGTFVQHFRLDSPAGTDAPPQGLLRYLSGPDPEGGLRVETELSWFAEQLRLLHGERVNGNERRLVFRELGPHSARTFFLTAHGGARAEATELGGPEVVRRTYSAAGELPLFLVESARRGFALPSTAEVFEPLGATLEPLTFTTQGGFEERTLAARRADGSLRWSVTFRGAEPVAWAWQDGGPRARAIAREEYERIRGEHELSVRVAGEAAARSARAGR
ncbi:MAG: hypothetical protein ABL998_13645 [Planctomycetota bacterium]